MCEQPIDDCLVDRIFKNFLSDNEFKVQFSLPED